MFPVFTVPPNAADVAEQMGTKFKFWYTDPLLSLALFKEGRPETGENWAEKLACELASRFGIPHAYYEFGKWCDRLGVVSPNFVPKDSRLIHGNELLNRAEMLNTDTNQYYRERNHTILRVLSFLRAGARSIGPPAGFQYQYSIETPLDIFIGYLLFDAWIANQDRHSENWGVIRDGKGKFSLAPSYDHGSSLARNETDGSRLRKMFTKDKGANVEAYILRARSALYPHGATDKTKSLLSSEAFVYAWKVRPAAGAYWLHRLRDIAPKDIFEIIDMIPDEFMSHISKEFTHKLLVLNRDRLINLNY